MRKSLLVVLVAMTAFTMNATSVPAADITPPWWRDKHSDPEVNRSTYQWWEFETDALQPFAEDGYVNPPGDLLEMPPQAAINTTGDWIDAFNGRTGIWPLSGQIDIMLQNYSNDPEKKVWIQLTWAPLDSQDPTDVPEFSGVGMAMGYPPLMTDLKFTHNWNAGGGWVHTLALLMFEPNPLFETISISGDIYVDEVIVDTICPEPATLLLLGLGVPFICKRGSRRQERYFPKST